MAAPDLIALNRSEHMYWAAEGYIGPINIPFMLRLDGPVDRALMRQTLRELVSGCPRLRSVIEPTAFSYRMRILPDDEQIDQLFDDAYQEELGIDAADRDALEALHNRLINRDLPLERGMPWCARFVPHATQPALLFSIHHIVGDGRSMVQILSAIMARLNGEPMKTWPLDDPSMLPAVMPVKWWQWPGNIVRWWRNARADKQAAQGLNIVTLIRRQSQRYTTSGICYHEVPCPAEDMKRLAKAHGTTVNTLLTHAIGNAFLALAPEDPQAAAAIRISVDLRRYFPQDKTPAFGNFVHSFLVLVRRHPDLKTQLTSLENQVKTHLARYQRREYALPLLFYEALPLLGRNLFSYLIVNSKTKGTLPTLSGHITNLGASEFINPPNARTRANELWPTTLSSAFLIFAVILNGRQFLCLVHQHDEIPHEAVAAFREAFDKQMEQLMTANP